MPKKLSAVAVEKLIQEALAIEEESAKDAGALGFIARCMVQATLPHSQVKEPFFQRKNGNFQLSMMANPSIGLPYGSVPRILLAWISTEAIRKKDPTLLLGDTLTSFMTELDLVPTGGRWGTIPRLRSQMQRLFSCTISCNYSDPQGGGVSGVNFLIADSYAMWWRPQQPDQVGLWQSHVTLGRKFYDEIIANSVPIDMRALKALRRSPLALDLYTWLTYRMSYLSRPTEIPWEALAAQFGADYTDLKHFKPEFRSALKKVLLQYPKARVGEGKFGVTLQPSPSHVKTIHK